ncbi:MAG: hypothetical protein R3320_14025 [Nitriliruptorales bacterium]|nr:hypothetical protein [Nitriliruptorales bacterium]
MDWSAVWWGVTRDVEVALEHGPVGWFVLLVVFGLPVGAAVVTALGSRLAVIPLCISGGMGALWVLYYGIDSWPGGGLATAVFPLLIVLFGWGLLILAIRRLGTPDMRHLGDQVTSRVP